jgi:multicomponent Na+:H+ antiporter subunit D
MLALPIAITWVGAVALVLLDGRRRWVAWLAVAVAAAGFGAVAALAALVVTGGTRELVAGGWAPGVGIVLRADALGVAFAALSSGVLLVALMHEVVAGTRSRTFPALVLFLATGLTGLFLTGDIFNFYVFFELSMIAAYVLTAYGGRARQTAGAFIFAVVNLLGSFIFLLAVAAIYHVTGTLEMEEVARRISVVEPSTVILIAVAVLVAFGVKLGLFPFHFWLPIVYTGAQPAVAAMLGGALASIGSYGVLRFGAGLLPRELEFGALALLAIGGASILYGSLQAVSRRTAPEVLAYSSIGQVGYVLVALSVGGRVGLAAAVVCSLVNALNKALLFLATGLSGWLVSTVFVVGALSVVGVPPSAGFFGKAALFRAGLEAGDAAVVVLLFLGGALSFVYMFQIYQHDHWRPVLRPQRGGPSPWLARAIAAGLAALVLALGVWPEPLLAIGEDAATALLGDR